MKNKDVKEMKSKDEKETKQGPQFVSGVIMKITDSKPLPAKKIIKVRYELSLFIKSSIGGEYDFKMNHKMFVFLLYS